MTREEIDNRIEELYERLDNLEIEDNEIYKDEIREIRNEISELECMDADPIDFTFNVTISGLATMDGETLEEAKAKLYDLLKDHRDMVVYTVDIEEAF